MPSRPSSLDLRQARCDAPSCSAALHACNIDWIRFAALGSRRFSVFGAPPSVEPDTSISTCRIAVAARRQRQCRCRHRPCSWWNRRKNACPPWAPVQRAAGSAGETELGWRVARCSSAALPTQMPASSVRLARPSSKNGSHHALKRDAIRMNRHRALDCCSSVIFSENRCALFRITH